MFSTKPFVTLSQPCRQTLGVVALLWCALFSSTVQAALAPEDFSHRIPLEVSGEGPWYQLTLPMSVYFAAAQADLRDVRVFDAQGEAVPIGFSRATLESTNDTQVTSARVFPLRTAKNTPVKLSNIHIELNSQGSIVKVTSPSTTSVDDTLLRGWLLDLGRLHTSLERLQLHWESGPEGFQLFSIEASEDLQQWRAWKEGQIVQLVFNGDHIIERDVSLSGRQARYLRLIWRQQAQVPTLTSAKIFSTRTATHPAPMVWSDPLLAPEKIEDSYLWSLPLALPLESVRFDSLQPNTLAPVEIFGRTLPQDPRFDNNKHLNTHSLKSAILHGHRYPNTSAFNEHWISLIKGVLYRLPVNGVDSEQNELRLPNIPVQQIRLQVDHRGAGLGKVNPTLRVGMTATQLVFLARGTPPFLLAVGNTTADAVDLPMTTLVPGYNAMHEGAFGQAVMNEPGLNPVAHRLTDEQASSGTNWKKYSLWVILLAGVGLLAWMAQQVLRKPS